LVGFKRKTGILYHFLWISKYFSNEVFDKLLDGWAKSLYPILVNGGVGIAKQ